MILELAHTKTSEAQKTLVERVENIISADISNFVQTQQKGHDKLLAENEKLVARLNAQNDKSDSQSDEEELITPTEK